jgi:hypothetical protein
MKPCKPLFLILPAAFMLLTVFPAGLLHAERRREHTKIDCFKITEEWLNARNKNIPQSAKALCDKYAAELNQDIDGFNPMDGAGLFGDTLTMSNFDPESDALLKTLPLSEAAKLGIPLETSSKIGKSVSQKLRYLRALTFPTRTLIIADYSFPTAGAKAGDSSDSGLDLGLGSAINAQSQQAGTTPTVQTTPAIQTTPTAQPTPAITAPSKPEGRFISWSNSLDIYLQDKSGVRPIFHEDRAECQAHLFRIDEKSPFFIQIKLSGTGSGNTGFLYWLNPDGKLEEKLAFGGLRGGYLAVQDFKAEGKMIFDVKQAKDVFNLTESQRDDCPSFVIPTIFEMYMYKWDGTQFQKQCKYYYESND